MPFSMPSRQTLGVRHEQVVADKLYFAAKFIGQQLPAFPIVLGAAVFDGDDRIFVRPDRQ